MPAEMTPTEEPAVAAKYRKKPVVIEAMQWDGTASGATPIIDWILSNGGTATFDDYDGHAAVLRIRTLEGDMEVSARDQVIKGVQGEFYPCKPLIFEATYEPAGI
jgi:hypothetical protein